jgi:hypothetical protein
VRSRVTRGIRVGERFWVKGVDGHVPRRERLSLRRRGREPQNWPPRRHDWGPPVRVDRPLQGYSEEEINRSGKPTRCRSKRDDAAGSTDKYMLALRISHAQTTSVRLARGLARRSHSRPRCSRTTDIEPEQRALRAEHRAAGRCARMRARGVCRCAWIGSGVQRLRSGAWG